jgi:hypothetical protein
MDKEKEPIVIPGKTAEEVIENFKKKAEELGLDLKEVKRA